MSSAPTLSSPLEELLDSKLAAIFGSIVGEDDHHFCFTLMQSDRHISLYWRARYGFRETSSLGIHVERSTPNLGATLVRHTRYMGIQARRWIVARKAA